MRSIKSLAREAYRNRYTFDTVTSELTNIWRWKPIEGYWSLVRDTYPENTARWLEILQGDEPGTHFKVSKRRPLKAPKAGATKA